MIPAGYMAKRVASGPEWLKAANIATVYSVSGCISKEFADYIDYWKHNGYWFFDSPDIISNLAKEHDVDLTQTTLFYYEVYENEFWEDEKTWVQVAPDGAFTTIVVLPERKVLQGYDVVTFSMNTTPECSPLSCNMVAEHVKVNENCLLNSLEDAKALLEQGKFNKTEPGPFRIFGVYTVD